MSPQRKFTVKDFLGRLLAIALGISLLVACGDDDAPTQPTATSTIDVSPTPPSTPTVGPKGTGVPIANRVVEAIAARDATMLANLIEPQSVPCSNAAGVGGPPACSGAPGNPPEGTPVQAFAYGTCEREWQFDLAQFGERFLDQVGEMYGVVRLIELPAESGFPPDAGYAVIYAHVDPSIETAHALIVSEDAIVAADSLCGGAPAVFLLDGPPFFGPEVIYRGPASDQ